MTEIYHITHIQNLQSIIETNNLWCDREVANGTVDALGIAHQHIKDRRAHREVPLGLGGTLDNYVPFYFAPRSPMLYSIHRGNVEGYQGGQNSVIHLEAIAENVAAAGLPFIFTDGHAEMAISKFFSELKDLDVIDWDVMQAKYWRDTSEDGDKKRRRQAEFLVYERFPWGLITRIGVRLKTTASEVQDIINSIGNPHTPEVVVSPNWYYLGSSK